MEIANIVIAALIIVAYLVMIVICIIQGGKIEAIRKAYDELSVQYTEALKDAREENELLKKQITHDPMTPVRITEQRLKVKEIKKIATIGLMPLEQTEFCLRDAVLMEVAPLIKILQNQSNLTATATLLIVENEEEG